MVGGGGALPEPEEESATGFAPTIAVSAAGSEERGALDGGTSMPSAWPASVFASSMVTSGTAESASTTGAVPDFKAASFSCFFFATRFLLY